MTSDPPNLSDSRLVPGTRFRVVFVSETGSTNQDLLEAAAAGAEPGLVLVADHQTAGRGRLDRQWVSAPGASLLVSMLLPPTEPDMAAHIVGAAALALSDALHALTGLHPRVKWPNDLVVDDRKLAGVLTETAIIGGTVQAVVVGIGCNLSPDAIPPELKDVATDVRSESGEACDRNALLETMLHRLDARIDALELVSADLAARSATLGRRVLIERPHGTLVGVASGLTPTGALVVIDDTGHETEVRVGDVVHLRHRQP